MEFQQGVISNKTIGQRPILECKVTWNIQYLKELANGTHYFFASLFFLRCQFQWKDLSTTTQLCFQFSLRIAVKHLNVVVTSIHNALINPSEFKSSSGYLKLFCVLGPEIWGLIHYFVPRKGSQNKPTYHSRAAVRPSVWKRLKWGGLPWVPSD